MTLTTAQLSTLKAYIEANPTWIAYSHDSDGAEQIARDLQATSSPLFVVWRTSVTEQEYTNYPSWQGTNWSWTVFIARSIAEKAGYERMFIGGAIDPSKENIRDGFVDVFNGENAQLLHMSAVSKRETNLLEELFATGTGTVNAPAVMEVEGSLTYKDILLAMEW